MCWGLCGPIICADIWTICLLDWGARVRTQNKNRALRVGLVQGPTRALVVKNEKAAGIFIRGFNLREN